MRVTKIRLILWVSAILMIFLAGACNVQRGVVDEGQAGDATGQVSVVPTENALLWKIEKRGRPSSYLFGTIHIIDAEDYFLPVATMDAIEECDRMVFEIDMKEMTDLGANLSLLTQALMKDGIRLQDLLDQEDYDIVNDHFQKMGLPLVFLERIKPMFLSVFAGTDFSYDDLEMGDVVSYEMKFMELAGRQDMETGGLETIEYQMGIFDSIPYEDQARMLVQTIRTSDAESDIYNETIQLYLHQDISGMQEMMHAEESGLDGYEDLLVANRNRNWIPVMDEMMKDQPVFFAVGAGHLGGHEGVIALLREKGYTITPLP